MATGTVKWFNPTKGYGFIQPSGGGGRDLFVHISAVEQAGLSTLNEGQAVEYEIESNRGKGSAVTQDQVIVSERLRHCRMSALPPKTDIAEHRRHVLRRRIDLRDRR